MTKLHVICHGFITNKAMTNGNRGALAVEIFGNVPNIKKA